MKNKLIEKISNYFSPKKLHRYVITYQNMETEEYRHIISNYSSSLVKIKTALCNFLAFVDISDGWAIIKVEIETVEKPKKLVNINEVLNEFQSNQRFFK